MSHPEVTGVILAGGLARRMGGVDKGLQLLAGKALVAHVAERLAPQVGQLIINANRHQNEYADFGYPLLADQIPDFVGPLAGLHAALTSSSTPYVVTAPCDTPFLPLDLVDRLSAALHRQGAALAIARTGDRQHPVFCLCRRELATTLASYLQGGGRKVMQWCAEMDACEVDFTDQAAAFRNFNFLEDLEQHP